MWHRAGFIHQRVMDVIAARDVLDAARQEAHDANELVAKQTIIEVEKRRRYVADLANAAAKLRTRQPPPRSATASGRASRPPTLARNKVDDRRLRDGGRRFRRSSTPASPRRKPASPRPRQCSKKLHSAWTGMTADADVLAAFRRRSKEAAANSDHVPHCGALGRRAGQRPD